MSVLVYVFIFIFGLCLGSFANVLIDRTQAGKSILGRSKCDYCNYVLTWFDNIPIISFLLLGGKCKKCRKKLSWQYFLVELSTGLIFALTFWLASENRDFLVTGLEYYFWIAYSIFVAYILWIIFIWDLKYMIIPDFLVIIGLVATFIYTIFQYFIQFPLNGFSFILLKVLGGLVLGGFFGTLFYFSKGKWIGGGDVKIGFWLGLIVGLEMVYFLLLFSYVSGALVAVFLLLLSDKKMKSKIPFGPFLIISTYFIMFNQGLILKIWNSLLVL